MEDLARLKGDGPNPRVRRGVRHVPKSRAVPRPLAVRTSMRFPRVRAAFHGIDTQSQLSTT